LQNGQVRGGSMHRTPGFPYSPLFFHDELNPALIDIHMVAVL
jgi:hypothetical protein